MWTACLFLKTSIFPLLWRAEMTCDQIIAKVCRSVTSRFLRLDSWNFAWYLWIYVSQVGYAKKMSYQLPGVFSKIQVESTPPPRVATLVRTPACNRVKYSLYIRMTEYLIWFYSEQLEKDNLIYNYIFVLEIKRKRIDDLVQKTTFKLAYRLRFVVPV